MNGNPEKQVESLFHKVLQSPAPEREALLQEACGGDAELRASVDELLRAHEEAGAFLASGAILRESIRETGTPSTAEAAGTFVDNYKLLQQIGEGGFGIVWMAEQERPVRRRVALKIIKAGMDTREVVARFEQERQALAMMDHPNIAKVFDAGSTPAGRPFFVMELVKGGKITDYCDEQKLPTLERLKLFIQVCHAIQHAHQKGIIHRDLKPSNILVTLHDGVPVPKVIDFGVAKATQQQRLTDLTLFTQFEQMVGTPLYMSPEQAERSGLDIDTRSDIYSLGVLLYELLTGRTPFDPGAMMKQGLDEIRRVIREQEPQKPSTFVSTLALDLRTDLARHRQTDITKLTGQIRGDLDWIVMKALEKDRNRRYGTANGLAKDIERHLSSEPVQARPPTQLYRFRRFAKRNRGILAASSAVLVALLIGVSVSTWMFLKEKNVRERAVVAESKSRHVAQFLTDMLNGVGPLVALGRDTTLLREILNKTVERIGKDLKEQPEVEADLRSIIGKVFLAIGDYEQAAAMHGKALVIRKRLFGSAHVDVAHSLHNFARTLRVQGKLVEADNMQLEALTSFKHLLGNEHPHIATSLVHLGYVREDQGKLTDAEAIHREALAMRKNLLGEEHADVAESLDALAEVLRHSRKSAEEAEALMREALAMRRKLFGDEHPLVAHSLNNTGNVLCSRGNREEGVLMHREALAMLRKMLGNEHPDVAMLLSNVAHELENKAEAETMHREALAMRRKLLGDEHPNVADSLNNLAALLLEQGKLTEAESMHREALAIRKKLLGNEHPAVFNSLTNLGKVLRNRGKLGEAESSYREVLALQKRRSGDESPKLVPTINALARVLSEQGKVVEAEALESESLAILRKSAKDDPARLDAVSEVAEALYRRGKFAEAEPLYREVIDSRRGYLKAEDEEMIRPIASLARLLADWAWNDRTRIAGHGLKPPQNISSATRGEAQPALLRAEEAERLLRECLAARLRGATASHWRTDDTRSRLGGALLAVAVTEPGLTRESRRGKLREAESFLLEAHESLLRSPKNERKYLRDSFVRLARLYEALDKPDKAAAWQNQLDDFDTAEAQRDSVDRGDKENISKP